jgi:hypothetical protein
MLSIALQKLSVLRPAMYEMMELPNKIFLSSQIMKVDLYLGCRTNRKPEMASIAVVPCKYRKYMLLKRLKKLSINQDVS